jgi:hypothetical protein
LVLPPPAPPPPAQYALAAAAALPPPQSQPLALTTGQRHAQQLHERLKQGQARGGETLEQEHEQPVAPT